MTVFQFGVVLIFGFGSIAAFVYYVANLAEDGVGPAAKAKIKNIIQNFKATPTFRHAFITFTMMSDNYFGERLISFKAFRKSALMTTLWIFLVGIICFFLFPKYGSWLASTGLRGIVFKYGAIFFLVVLLVDFASVCITRAIVRRSKPSSFINMALMVALDLFASVSVFYLGMALTKYVVVDQAWLPFAESISIWLNLNHLPMALMTLNDLTSDMLQPNQDGTISIMGGLNTEIVYAFPEGVLFYSSLLTSFWLWLHSSSYVLLKFAFGFDSVKGWLISISNIEQKPFKSLGMIALLLYPLVVVLLIIVYAFAK